MAANSKSHSIPAGTCGILAQQNQVWKNASVPLEVKTLKPMVQSARRFARERRRPLESLVAIDDAVPSDVVSEMPQPGLSGLSIPEEYGSLDLGMYGDA